METENNSRLLDLKDFDEEALKAESEDLLALRYINKENAVFKRTKGGFVSLEYDGKTYERVGIYRTFPITEPDMYISIREANEKAREIGIVEKFTDLEKDQAEMMKEQLRLRYFLPQIEKIIDVKDEYGYAYFHVQTNFGSARFTIHMGSGSVTSLTESRILITDLDGNRFEIPDIYKLTVNERKKLDLFI